MRGTWPGGRNDTGTIKCVCECEDAGFPGKENEDTWFRLVKYKVLEFESQVGHGVYN